MIFFSPLEQFEVRLLQPLSFFGLFDISVTIVTAYLFLIVFFSVFLFLNSSRVMTVVPNRWQSFSELVYDFVLSLINQQVGVRFFSYFPILFVTFLFILFSNLLGLLPFGFTVTGHIIVTWVLALSFNLAWLFLGLGLNGLRFFKLFVPSGISAKPLLVIIVFIEVISYLIRTFSLSVRLFANMMAGHTLLHILSSFGVSFGYSKYPFLALFPFFLVLAIVMLEVGIAIIQAYVFLVLVTIYMSDVVSVDSH
jgi:ATP synthase subunit 6